MIHHGDCVEVMAAMDAESIDAIVTDPPYGLEFMGKEWDRLLHDSRDGWSNHGSLQRPRYEAGAAAQQWHTRWATEALRVAKPGAYLLAFGGTRTVHRLTVALEDAGWIIRDVLVWAYAQGFPKSKSSLKPAWEPIVLARKPGPLAPLNIDDCRLQSGPSTGGTKGSKTALGLMNDDGWEGRERTIDRAMTAGRWPANVILTDPIFDGGWEGVEGGDDGVSRFYHIPKASRSDREPDVPGLPTTLDGGVCGGDEDDLTEGKKRTIARQNTHPTVKPTRLMRHLIRLVTPEGGTVLDPFLGSGTTAKAAVLEGVEWVGIEREPEYIRIAEQRLVGLEPEPEQLEMT